MDVYGYQSYQYNQSDELAKQMFTHQALANTLPYDRGIPASNTMPAPTGMPWNPQNLPWGMQSPPQLVQFSAESSSVDKKSSVVHCKRKSYDVEPPIPAKQLITEEKMAAHLNCLHISSDFKPHSLSNEDVMDVVGTEGPALNVSESLKGHTIVLSEELKKIKDEPLLPAALIERLQQPCMSLMVWKPKDDVIGKPNKEKADDDPASTEEEKTKKRNGLLVTEGTDNMDVEM